MGIVKNVLIDILGKRDDLYEWRAYSASLSMSPGQEICILHTDAKLGDAIIISALVDAISTAYPLVTISVGTTAGFASYWQSHPDVDDVFVIPNRNMGNTIRKATHIERVGRALRGRFDFLVSFDSFAHFDTFLLIAVMAPKVTVGFGKPHYRRFDYVLPDYTFGIDKRHISERIVSLMRLFGIQQHYRDLRRHVAFPPAAHEAALRIVEAETPGRRRVFFNTYAAAASRSFEPDNVAKIITMLHSLDENITLFVNLPTHSSEAEREALRTCQMTAGTVVPVHPVRDMFTLFALVSQMDIVLTPDTAIGHIAAAFDKPVVCFYRDNHYNPIVWRPLCENCQSVHSLGGMTINDLDLSATHTALINVLQSQQPSGRCLSIDDTNELV